MGEVAMLGGKPPAIRTGAASAFSVEMKKIPLIPILNIHD